MKDEKDFSTRLMAFTFFYAIAIYLFMIGYFFWNKHIDYKSEKEIRQSFPRGREEILSLFSCAFSHSVLC